MILSSGCAPRRLTSPAHAGERGDHTAKAVPRPGTRPRMSRTKVLYLSRKINDRRYSWAFYNSISQFSANAEFDLLLILKGYFHHEVDRSFLELRSTLPTNVNIVKYDELQSVRRVFCLKLRDKLTATGSFSLHRGAASSPMGGFASTWILSSTPIRAGSSAAHRRIRKPK